MEQKFCKNISILQIILLAFLLTISSYSAFSADPQTNARAQELTLEAEKGDVGAQYHLGLLYYEADNAQTDPEALKWLHKAADTGVWRDGALALGVMYWKGRGTKQDFSEAYYWMLLSQFRHSDVFSESPPDALRQKLTPQELKIVRYRVADRVAQNDGWFLHLLAYDALFNSDYEDAYFWYSVGKRDEVKNHIEDADLLQTTKKHLTPEQRAAIDKRAREWKLKDNLNPKSPSSSSTP